MAEHFHINDPHLINQQWAETQYGTGLWEGFVE